MKKIFSIILILFLSSGIFADDKATITSGSVTYWQNFLALAIATDTTINLANGELYLSQTVVNQTSPTKYYIPLYKDASGVASGFSAAPYAIELYPIGDLTRVNHTIVKVTKKSDGTLSFGATGAPTYTFTVGTDFDLTYMKSSEGKDIIASVGYSKREISFEWLDGTNPNKTIVKIKTNTNISALNYPKSIVKDPPQRRK